MNQIGLLLLIVIYTFLAIIYIAREVLFIRKVKEIRIISYVRLMYSFVYGIIPAVSHYKYYTVGIQVEFVNYSPNGIRQLFLLLMFSIIGYISLSFGYSIRSENKQDEKKLTINKIIMPGVICLILGLVSIFLWTHVYGSPFNIIQYADYIRSGYTPIYNPFAFMKHLCQLVMFASYLFYIKLLDRENTRYKIIVFVLFVVSVFWSIFYLVANDGRMMAVIYFVIFIMFKLRVDIISEKSDVKKVIFKYIGLAVITLVAIPFSDVILDYFMYGEFGEFDNNSMFEIISKEFGFTIISGQTSLSVMGSGLYHLRILEDLWAGTMAWVPSRFTQNIITSLWEFNTSFWPTSTGEIPTDFISATIYD
ncbi:MAG: hypothetical protein WAX04_14690, partial [Oscillospiraceae bacterium]